MSDKIVYHSRIFDIREVTEPGGAKKAYLIHPGSVAIVPLLEKDGVMHVVLVRQTRGAAGERLLELPAGTREPGESAETTARRELPEEIGYACDSIERIGGFFLAPGYSSEFMDLFVARGLREEHAEADADEDIDVETIPLAEAVRRAYAGEFRDVKTVAGILMVAQSTHE